MLRAAQRGMLRVIIHTKKKIQKIKKETGGKDICDDEISEETQEEISTHDECDQDSRFFHSTTMKKNETSHEDNLEDWIEYVKRSTKEADENMLTQRRARA